MSQLSSTLLTVKIVIFCHLPSTLWAVATWRDYKTLVDVCTLLSALLKAHCIVFINSSSVQPWRLWGNFERKCLDRFNSRATLLYQWNVCSLFNSSLLSSQRVFHSFVLLLQHLQYHTGPRENNLWTLIPFSILFSN